MLIAVQVDYPVICDEPYLLVVFKLFLYEHLFAPGLKPLPADFINRGIYKICKRPFLLWMILR